MRYCLALAVASILGPVLALFGLDLLRADFAALTDPMMGMLWFIVMLFAVPIAMALALFDSFVVRALRGRFTRPLFALVMVSAGLAVGTVFALLASPEQGRAENLLLFPKLGGIVALLWAAVRPIPAEAVT